METGLEDFSTDELMKLAGGIAAKQQAGDRDIQELARIVAELAKRAK